MPKDPHGLLNPNRKCKQLLMRHPQTESNNLAIYQGQSNTPLSPLGKEQCQNAIAGLVAWEPEVIFSSPLDRCLSIAKPVAEQLGLELKVDDRLMELGFGIMEGLTFEEAAKRGYAFPWDITSGDWPIEGAESIPDFAARLISMADYLAGHEGRVATVTHGGVVRGITNYWLQMAKEAFWSMSVLNTDSAIFSIDSAGEIYLDGFGICPEWLIDFK